MPYDLSVSDFTWTATPKAKLLTVPDTCPICHHSVDARRVTGALTAADGRTLQCLFQCTRESCRSLFIGYYVGTPGGFQLQGTAPRAPTERQFPNEVKELSPTFVTVYNQAMAAEAAGLDEISGMGLRKALEFLIKDFAVGEHPTEADAIRKKALGACVTDYIEDPNLKATAQRATWLGNDETHYVRRWSDRDISDLKVLITLAVNWAQNVLLTKKYEAEMPE